MNNLKTVAILLVVGLLGIVAYKFALPHLISSKQKSTSDARATKGSISIAVDSWIGYYPLCSKNMKRKMRNAGYLLKCLDDKADYPSRIKKLEKGEIDFAVFTVDSYILNGMQQNFPGTIITVLDESSGGDALLAKKDKIKSLEDLKSGTHKIAYTPSSPSEHLLKAISVHFDISNLKGDAWKIETDGSTAAFKKLKSGKADAAVLWEPDVSKAIDRGFVKILGTEDTKRLIVDVLVVNRDFLQDKPKEIKLLLATYFKVLKGYRSNVEKFKKEIASTTRTEIKHVESMLKGVKWVNLTENATKWFGTTSDSDEELITTIDSTVQILQDYGDFEDNPIPDEDPYRLQNSSFIEELFSNGISGQFGKDFVKTSSDNSLTKKFKFLKNWDNLKEIGTLKIHPIVFQSGKASLSLEGKTQLDKAAANLEHYPNFRVLIKGHTGTRGSAEKNIKLSSARAASVKRYLEITYSIDSNRLRTIGHGGSKPLPRKPGESFRSYKYRLPRVELYLVSEVY